MKIKGCLTSLGVFLLAMRVFANDPLLSFAQESLGLNLAAIPFGQPAQSNNGYGLTSKPLQTQMMQQDLGDDPGVIWMTNSVSAKYHQDHSDRLLRFAIRDGKIVGARININSFQQEQSHLERAEQTRKELRQIETDLRKMREARKASLESPAVFDLRTGFMCGPGESLFLMELQITPSGTITVPDGVKKSGGF